MGAPGSTPDVAPDDVLRVFSQLDEPSSPLTAEEVVEKATCDAETTRNSLEHLAQRGVLRAKEIDGGSRVWWQSRSGISAQAAVGEEFTAFVDAVQDYAIFMLDPDGVVVSWNEGAERIKGYAEDEIVGQHFSTFYTEEEVADGVPERNLEAAASQGRVEDAGWRVRQDGSEFWADVVVTAIRDDGELQGFTKVTRDRTEQREYEQQLRRERDLTDRILETVPVSICLVTADGDVVRANQRMLERLGVDESELAEYDVESWEIYDADGEPIPVEEWPWRQVVDTGEAVYDYECRVDLPDVGGRWLTIDAAPIEDGHREDDLIVVSVDDVTDQKERERRLRREHDQTEKLLRTAPMAIAVTDAEGETVMANRRAQDALGLSEEEFLEEPDDVDEWDLFDADGDPIAPEEAPGARALATGEPVFGQEVTIDPPDGDSMQFRVNEAPLYGPDGETVERVVVAAEDITRLKERERLLEQRKTELETELSEILGRISDAFYALDDEWRFTHLNDQAAEILQRSEEEVLGETVWEAFPDAKDTVYWEQFQTAMETQEPVSFEVYAEKIDAWLEFNAYPSESGLSIYFHDVTERKAYQRRLEASNERLEQFAYAASHDLQEPLRMVSSYLQLLERRYDDELDEDGREFIEYAVDGADRMREMIEALLAYSRVETEGDPIEPVELDAVVENVLADLQLQIEETDADVTVGSLPRVEGDASQLRQLFQNLLDNALSYAGDEPPRIDVSAERAGREWLLSVRDEGVGIDPGEQDAIFEVFERLHSREEHPGTGIGLALCRRIVERHGGEIRVDSEPDEGATFTFTLPAADDGERAG